MVKRPMQACENWMAWLKYCLFVILLNELIVHPLKYDVCVFRLLDWVLRMKWLKIHFETMWYLTLMHTRVPSQVLNQPHSTWCWMAVGCLNSQTSLSVGVRFNLSEVNYERVSSQSFRYSICFSVSHFLPMNIESIGSFCSSASLAKLLNPLTF